MAKKKSKTKETVIMIRIPDANARHGDATLTIQRGDLGHIQEFSYSGLTLKGNIAEAVQAALLKLTKVEAAPPPELSAEATNVADETPDESDADTLDEVDSDDDEITAEASEDSLPDMESMSHPVDTNTGDIPQDEAENISQKVSVSANPEISVTPSDNQQMNLF